MRRSEDIIAEGCALLRVYGATEVYVFGSHARGVAGSGSDIDFAVRGVPDDIYFRLHGDLAEALGVPVDLVLLDSDTSFARHVLGKIERGWARRVG